MVLVQEVLQFCVAVTDAVAVELQDVASPRSTLAAFAIALSWFCGFWKDPEDPLSQDPEVAEKKVPDEDVLNNLVFSISDDSGLRDGVEGGTGLLQEEQLHDSNRRNSALELMLEHFR